MTKPGYILCIYGNVTTDGPVQLFCTSKNIFLNYCAGWEYIVEFTEVLTMYQIYDT
jgi:hypothetical protein